ncbi:hypothetical protein BS47DRAFT_1375013 [Hydnum rufescens UP504]|uniref:Uncharacterized protein n=1 Tax=Hydnum rufescens UP504 TaxID=1448309 RepID=A0A9P6BBE6_9AGAM|nr:hypothetical protein BS47DRAFT_1375013 [Hydnum rufescens UP504]
MWIPSPRPNGGNDVYNVSRELNGFWVVVPTGGFGSHLWPLSCEGHPKFLLNLTYHLMIVTGQAYAVGVQSQLPELQHCNLLGEPSLKDFVAAIGPLHSHPLLTLISGDEAILTAVTDAVVTAGHDYLVTIEFLGLKEAPNACRVSQFKEKPDGRTASQYLSTGNCRWNGGTFVVKAQMPVDLLREHAPELHAALEKIADGYCASRYLAFAIDNAVAKPAAVAGKVAVIPATYGWMLTVLLEQVAGGIVVPAANRLVACLGVDDLVIVGVPDVLLVTTRARSQGSLPFLL